jgi:small GTP-binding protein
MKRLDDDKLVRLSVTLANLANDDTKVAKTLTGVAERLNNLEFNLVLLGQFNRGKSTLANCLLGKEILPIGVVPLTSIVTEIRHGEKEEIRVYSLGDEKVYPIRKLQEFVTEKHNPKNKKKVERVVVFCKSDFIKNNVVLIDTPGISSTLLHNTKLTQDYLPNCDAAVLLISADSPLSNDELEFIKSIQRYAPKLFFVLNKSDYVSKKELSEMIEHVESELSRLGINANVVSVSSKLGLEAKIKRNKKLLKSSGILRLENDLTAFLSKSKSSALLESARLKLNSISKSLYNRLKSEHAAINMEVRDINIKSEEFANQFELIKHSALMYSSSLDSEFSDLISEIESDIEEAKQNLVNAVCSKIVNALKNEKSAKLIDYVNALVDKHTREELTKWRKGEDTKIESKLREIEKLYVRMINDTNQKVKDVSSRFFDFVPRPLSSKCRFDFRTSFYFRIEGFGRKSIIMPTLSGVLPSGFLRKKILKELEQKVGENVDINMSRILHYDYRERLEKCKEDFKEALVSGLESIKKEIESGLKKGRDMTKLTMEEKKDIIKNLNKKLSVLSEIIKTTE